MTHGYLSFGMAHTVASAIRDREQPLRVLYVRDWDPSGKVILEQIESRMWERLPKLGMPVDFFSIRRVALLDDDLESLPSVAVWPG